MHEKHLNLQKRFIECTIDIAQKMITDVLDPQCDRRTRSYAIEELLLSHQSMYESNDQEILLPTVDDVRKALETAKQRIKRAENGKEAHDITKQAIRHVEDGKKKDHSAVMEYQEHRHTLVATLDGQPQIVTFTLDLLLRQGIPISEVIVVYPASSPYLQRSLEQLNAEFVGDCYTFEGRSMTIHFRQQVLSYHDTIIDDIVDEMTASGALDTISELICNLNHQGRIIHFSISGGQHPISFLSFSAALLYFKAHDEFVHLYIPEHVKERVHGSSVMHLPPENGQRLIKMPFAHATQPLLALMFNRTPSATIQTQHEQRKEEERQRCQQVIDALTSRVREVLSALAQGLHPREVADTLYLDPSTISTHSARIYRECRNVWNVPEDIRLDYHFIQAKFAGYFSDEESI
jgi:CRISPR-associated protein Csx14